MATVEYKIGIDVATPPDRVMQLPTPLEVDKLSAELINCSLDSGSAVNDVKSARERQHRIRPNDLVRLTHPCWGERIRGKVTKVTEIDGDCLTLALIVDGKAPECSACHVEPVFRPGMTVGVDPLFQHVHGPTCLLVRHAEIGDKFFNPRAAQWLVRGSNGGESITASQWLVPADVNVPAPISEPIITGSCDWCGTTSQEVRGANGVIGATGCNTQACRDLEGFYRERLSVGGVDCPEEREAVRRFYERNRIDYPLLLPTSDTDRMIATRPRGEKMLSLDQRIAAARAEQEIKRGAWDWDCGSTASFEW